MYQEDNHRKWQSPPATNSLDLKSTNLKTFLQKRIKAIMAKEWWDFIVNVNTLNSDHASLLYSLANLCPSFNYFLQSRDKELHLIIKKRPVVKPRIFSGTERLDSTPEPIVPKQLPLVTRRNSANELVKILNELYPKDNTPKFKQPRLYGPASKQRKMQQMINKKNALITLENFTKKNNTTLGHSPLLTRLLEDESQKENAHSTNVKGEAQLSMPVLNKGDSDEFHKAILSNKNSDLNQNRFNLSTKKIKKMVKVKRKRYIFSNGQADTKKFILEDETPSLSFKLIKKYRIKKCTVDIPRLKDSVIDYYAELRYKNYCHAMENPSVSCEDTRINAAQVNHIQHSNPNTATLQVISEHNILNNSALQEIGKTNDQNISVLRTVSGQNISVLKEIVEHSNPVTSDVQTSDMCNPAISDAHAFNNHNNPTTSAAQSSDIHNTPTTSAAQSSDNHNSPTTSAAQIYDKPDNTTVSSAARAIDEQTNPNISAQPTSVSLHVEKGNEILEKTASQKHQKENTSMIEKYNSKELKNMYFHGGIVPLGKIAHNDKVNDLKNNKHFLSLKELKIRDVINETIESVLNQKNVETKSDVTITKTKNFDSEAQVSESSQTNESIEIISSNSEIENNGLTSINDDSILNTTSSSIESNSSGTLYIHENPSEPSQDEITSFDSSSGSSKSDRTGINESTSGNIEKDFNSDHIITANNKDSSEQNSMICYGSVELLSHTSQTETMPVLNKVKLLAKDSKEIEKNQKASDDEELYNANSGLKISSLSETSLEGTTVVENNKNVIENNDNLLQNTDENQEPLAKRPRIEINLTEMKLEITKTIVESESNNEHICKMCKLTFDSVESWNDHFENKVPKCTPNLKLSWDTAELSSLNK